MTGRFAVVDDHDLLAQSLATMLRMQGLEGEAWPVTDPASLVTRVRTERPGVILLDLHLGGHVGHGLRLIRPFTNAGARVLVVSGVTEHTEIAATMEEGAVGYVSKSEPFETLFRAAVAVGRGEEVFPPESRHRWLAELRAKRAEQLRQRAPFEQLSPREKEVLQALCEGRSVSAIAADSYVSLATVRTQVRAILTKLGVNSELEAVGQAHRCGWCNAEASQQDDDATRTA